MILEEETVLDERAIGWLLIFTLIQDRLKKVGTFSILFKIKE